MLIAGVASKPTDFMVNISALSAPGDKNISFIFRTGEENVNLKRPVSALYSVGNVSFTTGSNSCVIYGPLNEAFNISISYNGGTRAKVMWKINNNTVTKSPYKTLGNQIEITWQQNFTLYRIGEYPLIVLVSNEVSGKLLTATVIIQEKITGLTAAKANDKVIAYQGLSTQLTVNILTGNNVTYKWYFGDGSDVVTVTNMTVNHSYHKFGIIVTTVEATNMVSSMNYSFNIHVSNPVEIIVPPYAVSNVSTNITCKLAENSLQTYVIVLQVDNDSLVSSNCNTVEHALTPGLHDIHCYIQTVVVMYSNTTLFVVEPITGLSILDISPLALNEIRIVKANISTGNNVSYVWRVSTKEYNVYLNNSQSITFDQLGNIRVNVTASNAISTESAETTVTVQEPIGNLNIASDNPAKTNSEISFHIQPTAGSEVHYTVNISTIEYLDLGRTPNFTHTFSKEGTYNIFISATNLISSSNTTYPITVQVPVTSPPAITCPSVTIDKKTCVVSTIKPWTFKAEIPYATSVTFEWTWEGQGNTIDDSPNITSNNITSTAVQTFRAPKAFIISVVAKNDVSNLTNELHVETLDEVSNFTFHAPRAVVVNTTFAINANINNGSNVTYSYDLGDHIGKISVANQTTNYKYTKVGVYQIRGNASNLVSHKITSREITVQQEITGVYIEKVRTVETHKSRTIKWSVTGGTNVTSNVHFGDKSKNGSIEYPECQLDDVTSTYICTTTHSWSRSGTYEVFIVANNLLTTTKSAIISVTVQDPVEGFTVKINSVHLQQYYYTHQDIPLIFGQTKGSNVKYRIYLNDTDGRIENTSETNFEIRYYEKGVYKPWFQAYNDISSKKYVNLVSIDIKRPRTPKPIEGLTLSAEPTRFGETTKFEVSYKNGALFTCTINFGDGHSSPILEADLNKGASHKYEKTDEFTAKLECKNTKGSENLKKVKTQVFVQIPIVGFKLRDSSIRADFKVEVNIEFSWRNASHIKVIAYDENNRVVPHDSTNDASRSGKIILPWNYFPSPGRYIIRVNASNKVSSLVKPEIVSVNIIEKITGVKVLFNDRVPVSYGLRAYLSVETGSNLQVTWDFGDGSAEKVTNCSIRGSSCFSDHTYTKMGRYTIKARAKNELNSGESDGSVTIQYPILGWGFEQVNINRAYEESRVKLVRNDSFDFPTDAKYKITFTLHGNPTAESNLTEGTLKERHVYKQAGCHPAKVKIWNLVSTVVIETKIKVRGDYEKPTISATSLNEDNNSPTLPLEYPVKFKSNIDNNCLKYNWTITKEEDSTVLTVNHSEFFEYRFNVSGTYKIKLIAYDGDSNDIIEAERSVSLDKSVTGLFLSSDGVGKVNESIEFILLWATLGDKTEFKIDYKDGKHKKLSQKEVLDNKTDQLAEYRSKLPFDPTKLEGISFAHTFTKIGKYEVVVTVQNTNQTRQTRVSISKAPCPLPIITTTGGSKDANRAPEVPYEVQYTLFSTVKMGKCEDEIKTDFEWRVFRADEYLLKTTGPSVIPPDENREVE